MPPCGSDGSTRKRLAIEDLVHLKDWGASRRDARTGAVSKRHEAELKKQANTLKYGIQASSSRSPAQPRCICDPSGIEDRLNTRCDPAVSRALNRRLISAIPPG
jgi:hypothetical protein